MDVMYIQMHRSDIYPYVNTTDIEPKPIARPILGAWFFVTFVLFGTMIMLNLFIGVILNSMEEVRRTNEQEQETLAQVADKPASTAAALALISQRLNAIHDRLDAVQKQIGTG